MITRTLIILLLVLPAGVFAQGDRVLDSVATPQPTPRFNLHFQTTYVYQYKPEFSAKYSGPNSLSKLEEKQNSITATLYFGARLWNSGEIYVNPEVAGGSGLSGAFGLAASSNGETFRVGDPAPTLYLARGYFRQTFALGATKNFAPDQANQIQSFEPKEYVRFYLGKISLGDIFDNNEYANSPRTQFLNWCLMNNGAWDYAANVRGYTYAFATVVAKGNMMYKAALATLPTVANGPELNANLNEAYGVNAEIDKSYMLNKRPGNVRLLGYYNNGHMGNYKLATEHVFTAPDVTATRAYGRTKTGISINADQQLSDALGIFGRAGWNDGKNETWVFTEADRSISLGISVNGAPWKLSDHNLGFAVVMNGLSKEHSDYLKAGGMGFQLGDGTLNYANETAAELYYAVKCFKNGIWLTGDYQFILNPGYNSDRGPLSVFSFRVHVEL